MNDNDIFEDKEKARTPTRKPSPTLTKEEKSVMERRVSHFNPELAKLEKVDLLVADECKDSLSDLAEKEITCIAAYRALNNRVIEIPAMMDFLDNIVSLRRSRNAQTAQNLVEILKRRPTYYHSPFDSEMEDRQPDKPKWYQFWKKK